MHKMHLSWAQRSNSHTPCKNEHGTQKWRFWKMIFLFTWVLSRFQPLIFRGVRIFLIWFVGSVGFWLGRGKKPHWIWCLRWFLFADSTDSDPMGCITLKSYHLGNMVCIFFNHRTSNSNVVVSIVTHSYQQFQFQASKGDFLQVPPLKSHLNKAQIVRLDRLESSDSQPGDFLLP